jgi:hypothetical protein
MGKRQNRKKKQSREVDPARLVALGAASPANRIGAATEREGQVVERFKKELISVGVYRHPVFEWTLEITTERMDRLIANSRRMQEAGVKVPVVGDEATHVVVPSETLGYQVEMFREGETLFGIHELVGQEQIDLALRVDQVSIGIDRNFYDGEGAYYGEVIDHVSVTPTPVVPGQAGYERLAASREAEPEKLPVFVLSSDGTEEIEEMQELITKLRELLGAGDDLTEENALSRIQERLDAAAEEKKGLEEQLTELSAKVATLEKAQASRDDGEDEAPTLAPEMEDALVESTETKLSILVDQGRITPAVKDELHAALIGDQGSRQVLCLSRSASKTEVSIAHAVCAALAKNDPVELGEQTGHQVVKLSREVPGGEEKPDPQDIKDRAKRMASRIGATVE